MILEEGTILRQYAVFSPDPKEDETPVSMAMWQFENYANLALISRKQRIQYSPLQMVDQQSLILNVTL